MRITLPTIATIETQRPPVATTGMTPLNITVPPSGHDGNYTPLIVIYGHSAPNGHNGNDTLQCHSAPQWPQRESQPPQR